MCVCVIRHQIAVRNKAIEIERERDVYVRQGDRDCVVGKEKRTILFRYCISYTKYLRILRQSQYYARTTNAQNGITDYCLNLSFG